MDDLISRQAALDAIRSIKAITGTSDDTILLIDKAEAQTELMMLPAAQPQRMKGRWIRDDFGSFCESCGLYAYLDKFGEVWESNYCPNCGADMRGEQND